MARGTKKSLRNLFPTVEYCVFRRLLSRPLFFSKMKIMFLRRFGRIEGVVRVTNSPTMGFFFFFFGFMALQNNVFQSSSFMHVIVDSLKLFFNIALTSTILYFQQKKIVIICDTSQTVNGSYIVIRFVILNEL